MIFLASILAPIIVLGCLYSLLGAGFVIIYKANRILNFAHAELVVLSAYITVSITGFIGNNVIDLLITLFIAFLLGLIVYYLLIKPLVGYSILSPIMVTVALGVVLNAITILIWRGRMECIPLSWRGYYSFPGGFRLSSAEFIIIAGTTLYFIVMGLFYRFSKTGQRMRGTAERPLLAAQRGIKIYSISALAWGLGFVTLAFSAILLGINFSVSLQMGNMAILGFVVALVGGLDSLKGAIPAGFIIAATQQLAVYFVNARLSAAIPFFILLLVLICKPWGFFGTEEEIERV